MEKAFLFIIMEIFIKEIGSTTMQMDMESSMEQMALFIRDNGRMTFSKEKAKKSGKKALNMKESSQKELNRVKENICLHLETSI